MTKRHRPTTTQPSVAAATAAVAVAIGSISQVQAVHYDFGAFACSSSSTNVHPSLTPTLRRRRPSTTTRWNVVTPLSTAHGQKEENVEEPSPHATKGGRKKPKKQNDETETKSSKLPGTHPRTRSFGAITHATYKSHGRQIDPDVLPVHVHTLILGTHPGIQSLEKLEYYGHPMNAFWWIAGDCLGFRRDTGISPSSGKPYQLTSHLRHGPDRILPSYQDQLHVLTSHGFALWDIVQSCERPRNSSLDSHISQDQPNDIPQFCREHRHSLKRIVLANGTSGYSFFKRHFAQWLKSGEWQVVSVLADNKNNGNTRVTNPPTAGTKTSTIDIIPALAVSPAAAKYSYVEKRDFWEKHVYQPGLQDYFANQSMSLPDTPRNSQVAKPIDVDA